MSINDCTGKRLNGLLVSYSREKIEHRPLN